MPARPTVNTSLTTAAVLAAAEAYRASGLRPEHDLVFAAVAQEETGLRGMKALFEQSLAGPVGALYSGTRAAVRVAVNLPESECGPILHKVMATHPDTYLKAFVALSERTEDGQRLPVDVVARGDDAAGAQALLDAALGMFRELAGEKGREVEVLEE